MAQDFVVQASPSLGPLQRDTEVMCSGASLTASVVFVAVLLGPGMSQRRYRVAEARVRMEWASLATMCSRTARRRALALVGRPRCLEKRVCKSEMVFDVGRDVCDETDAVPEYCGGLGGPGGLKVFLVVPRMGCLSGRYRGFVRRRRGRWIGLIQKCILCKWRVAT